MAHPDLEAGDHGLIERCHAIAEDLNSRGALDLAVPFYRQTIALLLGERQQAHTADIQLETGLLAAAADAAPAADCDRQPPADLGHHLAALEDELTVENTTLVRQMLEELELQLEQPCAALIGLKARTHLLDGDLSRAQELYQQALALAPEEPRYRFNCGAALLAAGEPREAVKLLRQVWQQRDTIHEPGLLQALLANLAQAELALGRVAEAARLRADLAGYAPDELPLEDWLEDARQWCSSGRRQEARQLLTALRAVQPQHQGVLSLLAETLEALGDYRDAALVYRDLLRPALRLA